MLSLPTATLLFTLGLTLAAPTSPNPLYPRSLNPSCAPGGNFDLSKFNLQLPTGESFHPDQIPGSKLAGCSGYENNVFYTNKSDGALVLKVCGSSSSCGCVTTKNSKHCRSELREATPTSWSPKAPVNRLRATLKVVKADDSAHGTVVGQIHVDDAVSKKPVCELFVNAKGEVSMGVEQVPDESSLKFTKVGKVAIGEKFEYEIRYEKGKLSVGIDGGEMKVLGTGGLKSPKSYFKAGNYNQGQSASEVHFYSIDVQHGGEKKGAHVEE
ncbi:polysaccharide lyase family 7 protein [Karstenula rhodostoma CBS 690.94]|uniref:Polysaccharide lyase family 7 protein n=1 Tax=Karstenula rhodostoma CBS 690.94 TaxID=1392251 RepID=A0A9P4PME4_9PLEO|nr:polysaccharide lyase family 7 protein [Karstenula rhodostoma CBS 690.94]